MFDNGIKKNAINREIFCCRKFHGLPYGGKYSMGQFLRMGNLVTFHSSISWIRTIVPFNEHINCLI